MGDQVERNDADEPFRCDANATVSLDLIFLQNAHYH